MGNRTPRNPFEWSLWRVLKKTKRAEYEPFTLSYTLENKYLPDFTLKRLHGQRPLVIEGKGKFTAQDRRKMVKVKDTHPNIEFRFVFYRAATKIRKGSKTTYGDWATKNGFVWADKTIPKSWLKE